MQVRGCFDREHDAGVHLLSERRQQALYPPHMWRWRFDLIDTRLTDVPGRSSFRYLVVAYLR